MAVFFPRSGRTTPIAVLVVTLLVFAGVVGYLTMRLRTGLREQILQREAEALSEVASLQLATEAETVGGLEVTDVPGELLAAVLKTSKMRGVFAVRVFDRTQKFTGAVPIPWSETPPAPEIWTQLERGKAFARLHSRESAAEVIGLAPETSGRRGSDTLLETWLPLRRSEKAPLAGVAQMWTVGESIADEFAAVDRHLITQAILAWVSGAIIIGALLLWAFRRLAQANEALEERTDDLARANQELTLAAKTSALGAVTAHLMHELKNPVAGLEEFVASQAGPDTRAGSGGELAAASELTRRLRAMINDVAGVLRDEQEGGAHYSLTCAEIVELAEDKAKAVAEPCAITIETDANAKSSLPARRANLARLVLHNLLQNAIEASPRGGVVALSASEDSQFIRFDVADRGSGLPASVRERLFQPCGSTKRGGSGLGLALSQQLARQAGGRIELLRSDANGTCFQLVLEREPPIS